MITSEVKIKAKKSRWEYTNGQTRTKNQCRINDHQHEGGTT